MTDPDARKSTKGTGGDAPPNDPSATQTTGSIRIPPSIAEPKGGTALTILCHPQLERIGDRAILGELLPGNTAFLSRAMPAFVPPRRYGGLPLEDTRISRRHIQLTGVVGGGVRLGLAEIRPRVAHRGVSLRDGEEFTSDDVERGVVLEIAGRVVVLLHRVALIPDAHPCGLVGESDGMRKVWRDIERVADLEVPVLLRGETGTGKELLAHAIHKASARRDGPFVPVSLAAIPFEHANAELFGAGQGYFNLARGGTLFLDEVADAPPALQAMLFRALETGQIQGLGEHKFQKTDVRVIASTSANLEAKIAEGSFREPLLHRLVTYEIWVPPLRERRDDIGRLLVHFLREEARRMGEGHRLTTPADAIKPWLSASLVAQLADHDWPGNVRQLQNVVRQLVIGSKGLDQLQAGPAIKRLLAGSVPPPPPLPPQNGKQDDKESGDQDRDTLSPPPPTAQSPGEVIAKTPISPPPNAPHTIVLEFSRAKEVSDPFAFQFEPQDYHLRTGDGEYKTVRIEWNEALLQHLEAVRRPGCDPAIVQEMGDVLGRHPITVVPGAATTGWDVQDLKIKGPSDEKQLVFLTIRSAAAELYALPWELLTLKASGRHLGRVPEILVRYEWPNTKAAPESDHGAPRPEGGRILVVWSGAGGAVPAAEHIEAIQEAAEQGHYPFDAKKDVLPHASFRLLADTLRAAAAGEQPPISVVHLLCHGGSAGKTFGLVLRGDNESSVVVDANDMGTLLAEYAGMVRLVVVAACDGGNMGEPGNHLGSVAQMLHRAGIQSVIASRFPLSVSGSIQLTQVLYRELLVGPHSLEDAFLRARTELAHHTEQLDWASIQLYCRADERQDGGLRPVVDTRPVVIRPYRGLLPFKLKHSRFFFGREADITEIVKDLKALEQSNRPRFIVVTGASGVGKSSLVHAGAIPRLLSERGSSWTWARMRPGSQPRAALSQVLAQRPAASPPRPYLLIVDQFDEIFLQVGDAKERTMFAQALWALASDPNSAVSVMITLRVDFIEDCAPIVLDDRDHHLDEVVRDPKHQTRVAHMAPYQVRRAIEEPARLVGLELSPGLLDSILRDVGSEPGVLPLIEDTMDLLWQKRRGRTLRAEDYHELGGVTGALCRRADALIDNLDVEDVPAARKLLVRLVSMDEHAALGTRRRLPVEDVRPKASVEAARFDRVLKQLVNKRLLVRDADGEIETVELAHETLIRSWVRLREWVSADRARRRDP